MVIVALFVLGACGEPSPALQAKREATSKLDEAMTKIIFSNYDEVVNNFDLVKSNNLYGVTYTWVSDNPEVIEIEERADTFKAKVKRPNFEEGDKSATLTVTAVKEYTYVDKDGLEVTDKVEKTKSFTFTVLALAEGQSIFKIADVKSNQFALNDQVGIQGIVTSTFAETKGGFFVTDDTETVFVFANYTDLQIGDEVIVYGIKGNYFGATQITKPTGGSVSFTIVSNDNPIPAAEEIEIAEIANTSETDAVLPGQRYRAYALLTYEESGGYFNYYLSDPLTGDKIQIYYRSYVADTTELADYVNEYVNITFAVYYFDNRIPMWTVSYSEFEGSIELAEAPEFTDQDKAELVENGVAKLFGDFTAVSSTKVNLPSANEAYGATITWVSLSDNATIANGVLTWGIVTEDTDVKVKVTIVVGEYTLEKEYTITLKPLEPVSVAEFIAAPNDTILALEGIIFKYNQGAYLIDAAGDSVLLYQFSGGNTGDHVVVMGKKSTFNYTPQMQNTQLIGEPISTGNANPLTPIKMTVAEIHAVDYTTTDLWGKYVEIEGTIVPDGTYYMIQDGDKTVSLYQSNETVLAQLLNKRVVIKVWFYGISKTDGTGVWRMVFTGLEGEYREAEMSVEDKLQVVADTLPVKEGQEVTTNLTLPTTGAHNATIVWASNNEDVITAAGVVTRGAEDVTVKLTATITIDGEELVVEINVVVKADVVEAITVEEFLALPKGTVATVEGYIYLYNDGSYLISENGVAVLVYKYKGSAHGDKVIITGKKDLFNGTPQFAQTATLEKTISSGNTLPLTAVPMTIAQIVGSQFPGANLFGKYLEVEGTVVKDGSFYALSDGTNKLSLFQSNTAKLAELEGLEVTLKVIFYGNSKADGTGDWRAVFMGYEGEYVLPEMSAQEKIDASKELVTLEDGQEVTNDLVLPTEGKFGVVITWSSNNAAINAETGKVTRPAAGEADVEVTLTAVFEVDGVDETVTYVVVVKAIPETTGNDPVTVVASYSGLTSNMDDGNNAATIGLDASLFTVTSTKGSQTNHIGLNKDGKIRLYGNKSDGNGSTLTISIAAGYKITGVVIEFAASTNGATARLVLGGQTVNYLAADVVSKTQTYSALDITSFSLQNTHQTSGNVGQVWIKSITITYVPVN
jgi:hypothetical protein